MEQFETAPTDLSCAHGHASAVWAHADECVHSHLSGRGGVTDIYGTVQFKSWERVPFRVAEPKHRRLSGLVSRQGRGRCGETPGRLVGHASVERQAAANGSTLGYLPADSRHCLAMRLTVGAVGVGGIIDVGDVRVDVPVGIASRDRLSATPLSIVSKGISTHGIC